MVSVDINPRFRACSICTHTCFKEHGVDTGKNPNALFTRPPCFLIASVDLKKPWLPIPNEFLEAHKDDCHDAADLEDPSGNLWLVDIKSGMGGVAFREGWKPFVFSLNLKRGDQLLFSLIAKNRFYVYVLNRNGAEVIPASSKAHFKSSLPLNNKRKREPEEEKGSDDSDAESDSGSDSDDDEGSISGESESSEYDASKSEDEASDHEEDSKASSKVKKEKLDYGHKTPTGRGKVSSKVKLTTSHKKKAGDMAQKEKEGLLEPGWNSTTYESRRRPVTYDERERAMKAAQAFKTTRPSQLVLMKPSHVYRGFWLTIPGQYSRKHMPGERIQIKVQDTNGFQWPASWIKSDNHSGISGGWAAFSRDHCLEEGDVCVFEVLDNKDWTVLVNIFRVVDVDLKPNSRGGWEKTYKIVYGATRKERGGTTKSLLKKTGSSVKKSQAKSLPSHKKAKSTENFDIIDTPVKNPTKGRVTRSSADTSTKLEEVDVKPNISSMGLSAKNPPKSSFKVKQEIGADCGDVKPTLEQLKASLRPSSVDPFDTYEEKPNVLQFTPGLVKPEPVDGEGNTVSFKSERNWQDVSKIVGKRQSKVKAEQEFLVEFEGPVVLTNEPSSAVEKDGENWWVPFSQFSTDMSMCYLESSS